MKRNDKGRVAVLAAGLSLMCLLACLLVLSGQASPAWADPGTRYVAVSGEDKPDCSDPADPCRTVQYAVDAASPGDEIKVAAGVYTGVNNHGGLAQVLYISETLVVRGGYTTTGNYAGPPDPEGNETTLDAEGQGRGVYITGAISPTLEGLRITGGDATGLGGGISGWDSGGGLYVITAPVTISGCVVVSNTASTAGHGYGGGLRLYQSDATLLDNRVAGNIASTAGNGYGGGLHLYESNATLQDNRVVSNTASTAYYGGGGGLYLYRSAAALEGNTVISNTASTADYGYGGGLYLDHSAGTLEGNTVVSNTASTAGDGSGGGLYLYYSAGTLEGNTVVSNTASTAGEGMGGGLRLYASDATLQDNRVAGNIASTASYGWGGGLYLQFSAATLEGNTVVSNTASTAGEGMGGGLHLYRSDATLQNNRVAGNIASTASYGWGGGLYLQFSAATLEGNTVVSNTASTAGDGSGGGLYLQFSAATLEGNTVVSNTASTAGEGRGGGLHLYGSDATLQDNRVVSNLASTASYGGGGGLYLEQSAATLEGNTVVSNTASTGGYGDGGGLRLYQSNARLAGNRVAGNTASTAIEDGYGGGLLLVESGARLHGNTVVSNTASTAWNGYGGGLYLYQSAATLLGNTVVSNTATLSATATGYGGGVGVCESSPFTLTNNLVAGNQANTKGGGLWIHSNSPSSPTAGRLLHTTVADNTGSGGSGQGVFVGDYTTAAFSNTLIAGHSGVGITVTAGSTAALEATLWYGNAARTGGGGSILTGTVNVNGDPAFVDPAAWDYHLGLGSAAIDEGVNAGVGDDIDGDSRPQGGGYDIGADESVCVTGTAIVGPLLGLVGTAYPFSATITPASESAVVDYTWTPAPDSGQGTAHTEYTWPTDGPQTISVAVTSSCGTVEASHTLTLCQPLSSVSIAGPLAGTVGQTYAFASTIAPADASPPIAYTWTPEPDSGQGTAQATYSWATPGSATLYITVTHSCGTVSDAHVIDIGSGTWTIYLPLIVRP